eukprot:m.728555 g.728555  ORF g.728555 m.728555 type:complete len:59 (+) comp23045_c2_seq25:225-401(+)
MNGSHNSGVLGTKIVSTTFVKCGHENEMQQIALHAKHKFLGTESRHLCDMFKDNSTIG